MNRSIAFLVGVCVMLGSFAMSADDGKKGVGTKDKMAPGPAAMKSMEQVQSRMGGDPMMGARMKGLADRMQGMVTEMLGIVERCEGVMGDAGMMEDVKKTREAATKKEDEATSKPMAGEKGMRMRMMMGRQTSMQLNKTAATLASVLTFAKACSGIQNDDGAMKKADELTSQANTLASPSGMTKRMTKELEDIKDLTAQPMQRGMGFQYKTLVQMSELQEVMRESADLLKKADTVKNDKTISDRLDRGKDELKKMKDDTDSMMGQCKGMMKQRKETTEEMKEEAKGRQEEMKEEKQGRMEEQKEESGAAATPGANK